MSYKQAFNEHLRITILKLLHEQGNYSLTVSLLKDQLAVLSFAVSTDQLNTQCIWLQEQDLVTRKTVLDVPMVILSNRGADVATGVVTLDGVKRPSPK